METWNAEITVYESRFGDQNVSQIIGEGGGGIHSPEELFVLLNQKSFFQNGKSGSRTVWGRVMMVWCIVFSAFWKKYINRGNDIF